MSGIPTELEAAGCAVRTADLGKRYGRTTALAGVSLRVPEGSAYVLVGPNGAGKTTLLRILLDLVRPDGGAAEVFGLDPASAGASVRSRIGYVPERQDVVYAGLPVGRLLEHHAAYHASWDEAYAGRLARRLGVDLERKYGVLSKGQARRVQLILALAHRPPLLLLDEPTDGLDPVVRDEVLGLLSEHLSETGGTLVVSTHLVHEAERLADHLGVLRAGRLAAQLRRDDLFRRLRRYRAEVPEAWQPDSSLDAQVVGRNGTGREIQWTVWGDEAEVTARFAAAGARVRSVDPLTLEEAALTLLKMEV